MTPDELFHSRRNAPDAWGDEYSISAGWVSDVDLFRRTRKAVAANYTRGINSLLLSKQAVSSSEDAARVPVFISDDPAIDTCDLRLVQGAVQVMHYNTLQSYNEQHRPPGDLI